jgi:hypothetical protein
MNIVNMVIDLPEAYALKEFIVGQLYNISFLSSYDESNGRLDNLLCVSVNGTEATLFDSKHNRFWMSDGYRLWGIRNDKKMKAPAGTIMSVQNIS